MSESVQNTGTFVSNGARQLIPVPMGCDTFRVLNKTIIETPANNGFDFFWQTGFDNGTGFSITNPAAPVYAALAAGDGFTLIDPNLAVDVSTAIAFTATSNATSPVVSTANTGDLTVGSIVRLAQTANPTTVPNLCGIDFQVGALTANVSFTTQAVLATAPGAVGGAGQWRQIENLSPWRAYFIANVSQAANATVTFTTDHYFTPRTVDVSGNVVYEGDVVAFLVEDANSGMVELNGLQGNVLTVPATNQITVSINTLGFTAYTFPTAAQVLAAGNYLPASASVVNKDINLLYMSLPGGADLPGGANTNEMVWTATKSSNT